MLSTYSKLLRGWYSLKETNYAQIRTALAANSFIGYFRHANYFTCNNHIPNTTLISLNMDKANEYAAGASLSNEATLYNSNQLCMF